MRKIKFIVTFSTLLALIICLYPTFGLGAEGGDPGHAKRLTGVLNINEATKEQFMRLRGVNEELADKIVKYREANGPFKAIETLMKVEGFTEKLFSLNQPHLAVSGATTLRWVRIEKP